MHVCLFSRCLAFSSASSAHICRPSVRPLLRVCVQRRQEEKARSETEEDDLISDLSVQMTAMMAHSMMEQRQVLPLSHPFSLSPLFRCCHALSSRSCSSLTRNQCGPRVCECVYVHVCTCVHVSVRPFPCQASRGSPGRCRVRVWRNKCEGEDEGRQARQRVTSSRQMRQSRGRGRVRE